MFNTKNISINSVLLDSENARHGEKHSQAEIIKWMTSGLVGPKVFKLAAEIAAKGMSPFDRLGVIPSGAGEKEPWVVVEGNRRVTALKLLNNPKLCPDAKLRKHYEQLKRNAAVKPPLRIEFAIFKDFSDAAYWIKLRHGGELGGAGISSWGAKELDSFMDRLGAKSANRPAVQLLSYALSKGLINSDQFEEIPVTTLYRLLSTPSVREKLGCHVSKGQVYRVSDENYFDTAVASVLGVLAAKEINVTGLKTEPQRKSFAEDLKRRGGWLDYVKQDPVLLGEESAENDDIETLDPDDDKDPSVEGTAKPSGGNRGTRPSWDRNSLITKKDSISIPDGHGKVVNIVAELRRLKVDGSNATPIAVAMLLRALVEMSVERYCAIFGIKDDPLHLRIAKVADHMRQRNYLSRDQHELVLRLSRQEGGMLHVRTIQKYVHSPEFHPNKQLLNTLWDEISFFVGACWKASN